jgi:tetratricopeptide (TPR) repeat protein
LLLIIFWRDSRITAYKKVAHGEYEHLSRESPQRETEKRSEQFLQRGQSLDPLAEEQLSAFAKLLRLGESIMFDPTRRKTLEALLATLMAVVKPQGLLQPQSWQPLLSPETNLAKMNEATLQGLAKLMESCWQLSRGNELALAERLLSECMTKLVSLAQQPSKYQQNAAHLAAQGYRLYGIFAFHRNDLPTRELYDKQAVQYSLFSGDQNLLIASLKGLAQTYYYRGQYPQALQTFLEASQYTKDASPLLQSRVHMGLAVAYAHIDQRQEAFAYLGKAIGAFPDHPETDPCFSYADFDLPWLILGEGIVRTQLGETKQALEVFHRIEQPGILVPERIRIEIFNQQAKTAIVSGDLEQDSAYVQAGVTGAKTLGSQRRYSEAYNNFKQMVLLWPQEQRVQALAELFRE